MITRCTTICLALIISTVVQAQNVQPPENDPIQAAIDAFNQRTSKEAKEVTVVLPPPEPSTSDKKDGSHKKAEAGDPSAANKPLLVTGKPPADSSLIDAESGDIDPMLEKDAKPKTGLQVRIATIQGDSGKIDPTKIRLLAPFPPKPLNPAPSGWHYITSKTAPSFSRDVELSPGKKVTLTIRPHILVPDHVDATIFTVPEPGFKTALGFDQKATVSAILTDSISSLEEDSKELEHVIDQLEQLLVSLPND